LKSIYIIPCFNEEDSLTKLINSCIETNNNDKDIDFVLVDNGSTDASKTIINAATKQYSFIHGCFVSENIGYGFGIISGIRKALQLNQHEFIGWTHADLQIPLDTLLEANILLDQLSANHKDIYIRGRRKNRPFLLDIVFTQLMAAYTSLIHQNIYWDITGQPVLTNKNFLKKILNEAPNGFSFDAYTFIKAKKLNSKIIRFNVSFIDREQGQSSWNSGFFSKLKMSTYYMKEILKFKLQS
tara:strand:- start:564 stop:1286 length:723 start_codon:yes stop_codon:yes gene_type:complete